jgi:hypothetical protein
MMAEICTESISFEALSLETTSIFQKNSCLSLFSPTCEEHNRVVKIDSPSLTSLESLPMEKLTAKPKRARETWRK